MPTRRERMGRPMLDRRVVLRYEPPDAFREAGAQRSRGARARVVRATAELSRPAAPAFAPPASSEAAPANTDGWRGWWPNPPAPVPAGYAIPDPPRIAAPVTANAALPAVWQAAAAVGAAAWGEPALLEAALRADVLEGRGDETVIAGAELTKTLATIHLREADVAAVVGLAGASTFTPRGWTLRELDGGAWDLLSIARVWRRGRWTRVLAERRM